MIGRFVRWTVDGVVLLFAGYTFAFVPLGERTAFEHLRAIARTDAAREAQRELIEASQRLRDRILGQTPIETRGRPIPPKLAPDPIANASWSIREAPDAGADASLSGP